MKFNDEDAPERFNAGETPAINREYQMDNNLKTKTINKIDDYLSGKISKKEASDWAIAVMKQKNFAVDEMVLEDAITALCGLHDDDDRWDTAKDDLIYLKNCLLGGAPYVVTLEFSSQEKRNLRKTADSPTMARRKH